MKYIKAKARNQSYTFRRRMASVVGARPGGGGMEGVYCLFLLLEPPS